MRQGKFTSCIILVLLGYDAKMNLSLPHSSAAGVEFLKLLHSFPTLGRSLLFWAAETLHSV